MSDFSSLMGPFASRKPRQTPQQYQIVDPWAGSATMPVAQNMVFGRVGKAPQFTPTLSGTQPAQTTGLQATQGALTSAQPYYGTGLNTLQNTAAGMFLNPASTPAYQNLQATTTQAAKDLFGNLSSSVSNQTAGKGAYYSSARQRQQQDVARQLANQTAQYLGAQLFGQYGAERGLQQQAAQGGVTLTPQLAAQLFGQGTTLRQGQLDEDTLALRTFLANTGLSQQAIDDMFKFLGLTKPTVLPHIVGKSPFQGNLDQLSTEASAFGSVMGGIAAGGGKPFASSGGGGYYGI